MSACEICRESGKRKDSEKCYNCDSCRRPFHPSCLALTGSEVKCLELQQKRSLLYYCLDCKQGLNVLPSVLAKLSELADKVSNVETTLKCTSRDESCKKVTSLGYIASEAGAFNQQQQPAVQERHTIWQGVLKWIERAKNPNDPQNLTRHVPCHVSAKSKDLPDLKTDSWPQKLIMQLMPKQFIRKIGEAYMKNSKSLLFHPQNCEALDSLTKVMSSGFVGCVHFSSVPSPSSCNIKVLILMYAIEKRAYLGFIPNDQTAFVDRLRKVIRHQRNAREMIRQQGQSRSPREQPSAEQAANVRGRDTPAACERSTGGREPSLATADPPRDVVAEAPGSVERLGSSRRRRVRFAPYASHFGEGV